MGIYWADVQFYPFGAMRITKEVTLMDIATDEVHHFIFRPPFPLDLLDHKDFRSANFIHSVLGVLHWSVGIQSLAELTAAVPMKSVLLCNGSEKVVLFKQLMPHVHSVFMWKFLMEICRVKIYVPFPFIINYVPMPIV